MGYVIRHSLPNKLASPEFVDRIVGLIREGATIAVAARLCGVHPDSVGSWLTSGRDPDNPCHDFLTRMMNADAECENEAIIQWREINKEKKDYRSIQGFLSMRHKWSAPTTKIESTVTVNHHNDRADLDSLTEIELTAYLKAIEEAESILVHARGKQKLIEMAVIDVEAEEVA